MPFALARGYSLPAVGAKILVMDDDESMRDLLRLHLTNAGYEVRLAEDAVVAGHAILQDRPDLILADVQMPYMDGLEFARAVKSDPNVASIPVILVTARTDAEQCARKIGAVAYFIKPVVADRLLRAIALHVTSAI